jgi:hypothetical protein
MKKSYICTSCGGKELNFDAFAKWNENEQKFDFELTPFYFEEEKITYCIVCDNWTNFEETELE